MERTIDWERVVSLLTDLVNQPSKCVECDNKITKPQVAMLIETVCDECKLPPARVDLEKLGWIINESADGCMFEKRFNCLLEFTTKDGHIFCGFDSQVDVPLIEWELILRFIKEELE